MKDYDNPQSGATRLIKHCEPYPFWRSAFGLCVLIIGPILLGILIAIIIKIVADYMQKKTDMNRVKMKAAYHRARAKLAVRRTQIQNNIVDINQSSLKQIPDTPKSNPQNTLKSSNKIAPAPSNVHINTSFENIARVDRIKSDHRDDENQMIDPEKQQQNQQPNKPVSDSKLPQI